MRRGLLIGLVGCLLLAGAAGVRLLALHPPQDTASIGGSFAAVDQNGRPITDRDLVGKPSVIFFGFTYCPEICPTTLAAMTRWLTALGPVADRLNAVYVTIDPERDTPAQMRLYLGSFDPRIRGVTGTPAQIAAFARAYRVYYQKVALPGGGYTMDHSTAVYLMDRRGGFSGIISYREDEDRALAKLRTLVRG